MRRYALKCPKCDEELDLDVIRDMVQAWSEYLADVDEMLAKEGKEKEELA